MSFSRQLKQKAIKVWEDGYNHPFVQELGAGTLDKDKFKFYLLQDYLYLLEYAKVFALALTKADDEKMLGNLSAITKATLVDEMKLHHLYMKEFGISDEEVKNVRASLFNRTYTANMLATSLKGDLAHTLATVFPCAWTYCDYGKRLKEQYKDTLENNFYKSWIDTYSSSEFEDSFEWFYDALDELVKNKTESEKKVVEDIFISSVEFEYMFWEMAYNKQMSYVKNS
ncbi:thiaminase II [Aliarcobacter cryaerophilus]|uniref:Aminopyrimidine aminohydrolase n=1 Tax=Aliarcobacter cryaerophilus TaxID=28198 RepID=A0A2S9ST08_9BACT|nr:thiaminase II [Aliarcobacter cryaerophilus]PRM89723.1 thiaminase II [Aliarcobacter cryaerophilus]